MAKEVIKGAHDKAVRKVILKTKNLVKQLFKKYQTSHFNGMNYKVATQGIFWFGMAFVACIFFAFARIKQTGGGHGEATDQDSIKEDLK